MTGYDIDTIEPGDSGGGGGGGVPASANHTAVADDTAITDQRLYGWSLQNLNAGLSTLYIRFGTDAAATPFIAINLAENETITQAGLGISSDTGFFVTVESGSVAGLLYTS